MAKVKKSSAKSAKIPKQLGFAKTIWRHRYSHGGELRRERAGRRMRPLSTKDPLHLVFKINIAALPKGLRHPQTQVVVHQALRQCAKRFFVRIDQVSIQRDHIHCVVRASKRHLFQYFFQVVAGQIAQRVTGTFTQTYEGPRIWKARPFSRVVKGWKAYQTACNYVRLNEQEAKGIIPYQKLRLKSLAPKQIQEMWTGSA